MEVALKKVPVSFKSNEKYIRDYITSQLNYSAYIKGLVLDDMKRKGVLPGKAEERKIENSNTNCGFDF